MSDARAVLNAAIEQAEVRIEQYDCSIAKLETEIEAERAARDELHARAESCRAAIEALPVE